MLLSSLWQIVAACITTFGFGILFHVKGKNLIYTSFAGALSWAIYLFCISRNYGLSFCYFLPSFVLSLYSECIARLEKTNVTSIVVPAMIPLAPGGGIYYTMFYILQKKIPLGSFQRD